MRRLDPDVFKGIDKMGDVRGAVPATPVMAVYSGSMTDAWTGEVIGDRSDASLDNVIRMVKKKGRPVDVEAAPGRWIRVWPDATYLEVRQPKSITRLREMQDRRKKEVAKDARKKKVRALVKRIITLGKQEQRTQEPNGDEGPTDDSFLARAQAAKT